MSSNVFFGRFERFLRYRRNNTPEFKQKNATLELLKSSILVAFSGALRIHIAFLLLQTDSSIFTCIAGGLVIYSVYTLDRGLGSEEDIVNRKELSGSRKEIGLAVSMLTFVIGSYVLAKEGMLALAFLPFIIGFLYSKGITIGKFTLKLKGGLGVKNFVVGLTWGAFISGLAGSACNSMLPIVLVFTFFGIKLFINSAIYDFKDIKGDTLAGIKTLPVTLGARNTRNFLLGLHLLSHLMLGIALINGVLGFEPLIVLYSFICGLICIQNYTITDEEETSFLNFERTILVDGESASIVGLRTISNAFLA
ncbi:MAG: UbiA family prenyltransferase [Methanosarcina flavescens]|jgi:4-hydroxybenzoate polyprenyltransferase|uniref:Prenyltransferase n=1 Tax=Methanosarcina flavescens TaxID=1715806 RepID=A0A660HRP8_9EURY|nr:UbiA family prenyltransferase [Methanosarcina flavescens]AYK14913.1 prenyltransferase [Methanosarcina flavescens]NLK31656.1 UbiA family prenyltransferase [Methanosarcina flavescens]